MEEAKQLIVNTVTWNHHSYLPDFFQSLDAQTYKDFTVTVVDNASTDGAVRWMQSERPDVTVLRNFRNQGIARALNQSIALACSRWSSDVWASRYVAFVTPDLELDSSCLEQLVRTLESRPDVSAVVPKLLRAVLHVGEDDQRETEHTTIIDAVGAKLTRSRAHVLRGSGETDQGQYDAVTPIFGFSRNFVVMRLSALMEMNMGEREWFDESFGTGFEDADLSWRMRRAGKEILAVPTAIAWRHSARLASKNGSQEFQKCCARNQAWMIWKNDEWGNWLLHAPWILSSALIRWLGICTVSPWVRGRISAWADIGSLLKKRKQLFVNAQVRGKQMRQWFVS